MAKAGNTLTAIAAIFIVAAASKGGAGKLAHAADAHVASSAAVPMTSTAAVKAIDFAKAQIGKPYLYGATGPGEWDCSALTRGAYAAAGLSIGRTSEDQWAGMHHVTKPQPGDDVFMVGADGTWVSPGHVGIVVDPATDLMIDAYGSGTVVRYDRYGPRATAPGLQNVVGFADVGGP